MCFEQSCVYTIARCLHDKYCDNNIIIIINVTITECLSQDGPRVFADTRTASIKGISELNESESFVHRYTWNTDEYRYRRKLLVQPLLH